MSEILSIAEVFDAAQNVREQFETGSYDVECVAELYLQFAPRYNQEIVSKMLAAAPASFPKGNCGFTSVLLRDVLGQGEVSHGAFRYRRRQLGHTVLLLETQELPLVVADVTPDQFIPGLSIYVGAPLPAYRLPAKTE